MIATNARALDIAGAAVSGEASFDYNYLSAGDNVYPAVGGAKSDQYRFNQAQVVIKKETDEISFLARLNYVPTQVATDATNTTTASFGTLDQLEIFYKFSPEFSVGFGRFCTTLGFESPMKSENVFYSPTIALQGIIPGYNEGLRARYNPGEWLALTLSTYNQSTYNKFGDDYTPTKTTEFSATGVAGRFLWFAGYYYGTDTSTITPGLKIDKKTGDAWVTYNFSEQFSWSATFDSRAQKAEDADEQRAQSVSSQLSYIMGRHTAGLRYESLLGAGQLDALSGTTGVFYPGADKVEAWSLVDKYNLSDHMKLYLEFRQDKADTEVFKNKNGDNTDRGSIVTLGAVAHF
jgi:hypothetical protein